MSRFRTMTRGGIFGAEYEAPDWAAADAMAARDGYKVMDWVNSREFGILVIADDDDDLDLQEE